MGLNYNDLFGFQLFKIIDLTRDGFILESINEYDEWLYEVDTTKQVGLKYKLEKIPEFSTSDLQKRKEFFKGNFKVNYILKDSISFGNLLKGHLNDFSSQSSISELRFSHDSIQVVAVSEESEKYPYNIDECENLLILAGGSDYYDYLKYNLADSTIGFYELNYKVINPHRRKYTVFNSMIKLIKE